MEINSTFAANAYSQAQKLLQTPQPEVGQSFADVMQNLTQNLNTHESTARQAMMGQADPHALVEALTSAQMAVDTVVTVRDKVVAAYQELIRMPL